MRRFTLFLFLFFACVNYFCQDTLTNPFLVALEKIEKDDDDSYFKQISHNKDAGSNFAFYLCKAKLYATDKKDVAAFALYKKAIEMAPTNKEKAIANIKTGIYFARNTLYVQAMQYLNKAELIYNFNETEPGYAELNKHIGLVHSYTGSREKSNERFLKLYNLGLKTNNYELSTGASNNMAVNYIEIANYDEAEKFLNISLNMRIKANDKFWMGQSYNNLGTLYFDKGDYNKALLYFNKGYLLRKNFGNKPSAVIESEINLGKTYLKLNKTDLAEATLYAAFVKGKERNNKVNISNSAFYLKDIYVSKNNFKKAYEMQNEYRVAEDSVFGLNKRDEIHRMSLETEFKSKMLSDSISILNQENQIQIKTAQNKQNKLILVSLLVFLLVTLFMIVNLFRQNKKKNATNILVSNQAKALKNQNLEIVDSINYAKNLQVSLLPPKSIFLSELKDHFILFLPKDIVSGDFYWATSVSSKQSASTEKLSTADCRLFYFALGDCTGHGVPGSMVSILGITALNRCISEFKLSEPAQILEKLSTLISESFSKDNKQLNDGMDISFCSIEFYNNNQPYAGKLKWAGANNGLFIIRDNKPIEFKGTRRPIGGSTYHSKFEEEEFELKTGDQLYLFTDGYYDQFGGAEGKKFKQKNLKDLILKIHTLPMNEQREKLGASFYDWKKKHEQIDDVSVIGFKV